MPADPVEPRDDSAVEVRGAPAVEVRGAPAVEVRGAPAVEVRGAPAVEPRMRIMVLVVTAVLAWVGSGLAAFTWSSALGIMVPAGFVAVVVMRRPTRPIELEPTHRTTLRWWAYLAVAGLLWEAYAFFHQPTSITPSFDHPTLSVLVEPLLEHRVLGFVGWFAWLEVGWRSLVSLGAR